MEDEINAIKKIDDFLNDDSKRIILIKGYDHVAKLRAVIKSLNKIFELGIIRCVSMKNISDFINTAMNQNFLPRIVKSTEVYSIGQMSVQISSYMTNTKENLKGNENTFTLSYPVQSTLDKPERYRRFIEELGQIKSNKIVIITTNEWGICNWDIEKRVDEIFYFNMDNDNPNLLANLKERGVN